MANASPVGSRRGGELEGNEEQYSVPLGSRLNDTAEWLTAPVIPQETDIIERYRKAGTQLVKLLASPVRKARRPSSSLRGAPFPNGLLVILGLLDLLLLCVGRIVTVRARTP